MMLNVKHKINISDSVQVLSDLAYQQTNPIQCTDCKSEIIHKE